jgi:membrane protease subunit (stomatin/prohibitin family)
VSVFDFLKKQFIDVIQWTESDDDLLAWRFPTADLEIQQGARLIVRETQAALFVDEGRVADLFGPGQHTLRTANLPLLTDLRHWDKLLESPFKSEVYFFSRRLRIDQAWGTPSPITVRDHEFGAVRLRAFGVYRFRVADPRVMFRELSGTRPAYHVGDVDGQLRSTLVASLAKVLGEGRTPFLDMAANQGVLAAAVHAEAAATFTALGLGLEGFQIESISLPEELQRRLDERIGMGIVGDDLARYARFQAAQAIPTAAANEGGAAGAGVGLGAGVAMGQAMGQALTPPSGAQGPSPAAAPPTPTTQPAGPSPGATATCQHCGARLERLGRFCPECGTRLG